jgi:hypothetical protein
VFLKTIFGTTTSIINVSGVKFRFRYSYHPDFFKSDMDYIKTESKINLGEKI